MFRSRAEGDAGAVAHALAKGHSSIAHDESRLAMPLQLIFSRCITDSFDQARPDMDQSYRSIKSMDQPYQPYQSYQSSLQICSFQRSAARRFHPPSAFRMAPLGTMELLGTAQRVSLPACGLAFIFSHLKQFTNWGGGQNVVSLGRHQCWLWELV